MATTDTTTFEGWAILELMGHRRLAGWLSEQEIAGQGFLRIDVPAGDAEVMASQFYAPNSVYAITPCTEDIAREIARSAPRPVERWDLRKLLPERVAPVHDLEYDQEAEEEDSPAAFAVYYDVPESDEEEA